MAKSSLMRLTGKHLLIASIIALGLTVALATIYMLGGLSLTLASGEHFNLAALKSAFQQNFVPLFRTFGICVAPIVFILTFALLQRFRIKW